MQQIVSITSQGQITIPALMRRLLGLDEYKKALIQTKKNKIIIEPVPDILNLAGLLEKKALRNKTVEQIIKLEKEAVVAGIAKKYSLEK
ncbi:AbrB/MazE/SpoVT family DNA-binding domain-containing protein [Candidatus Microgenomates bacterium]|nr:AbrB/MazE/SpoVT family DNA-binding domain-containing protein [Candidatus Microgenomates bacterium]